MGLTQLQLVVSDNIKRCNLEGCGTNNRLSGRRASQTITHS